MKARLTRKGVYKMSVPREASSPPLTAAREQRLLSMVPHRASAVTDRACAVVEEYVRLPG